MATFAQTTDATPFGVFSNESVFQTEADNVVTYTKRMLGDDVISVELTKKQVWAALEQAALVYSAVLNEHQAKNQLATLLGHPTGSVTGSEGRYLRETLQFLERQAEPYAMQAGVGGSYNAVLGQIALVKNQQDYDLHSDLKDAQGSVVFTTQSGSRQTRLRVVEVFHFSPAAAYRFFDSTSAINYLNNEFSFESFTPETIFYVLPVFEDILRASQMNVSQKVRRSNYSYEIIGTKLRIFPEPTHDSPRNLYVRVMINPDPMRPPYADDTVFGISNVSNVPFGTLKYAAINSMGRQWIRQYCLALSKELLGLVRSKFSSVPIPGADLQLNGAALIDQGREDQEKLRTQLKESLDSLTYDQLMVKEAEKTENVMRVLKGIPMPRGLAISVG